MHVRGKGLQAHGCHLIVEEKKRPTLMADVSWVEKSISKANHCVARPNTLSTAVLQQMLLTYYNYYVLHVHQ